MTSLSPGEVSRAPVDVRLTSRLIWDGRYLALLAVEGDPRFRLRFGGTGANKEIGDVFCFEGRPVREKVYHVHDITVVGGRMAPVLELGTVNGTPV